MSVKLNENNRMIQTILSKWTESQNIFSVNVMCFFLYVDKCEVIFSLSFFFTLTRTPKSPQKDSDSSSSDISSSPRTLNVENLKSTSGSTTYSTLPKDHKVSSKLNGHAKTGVGNTNDLSVIGKVVVIL